MPQRLYARSVAFCNNPEGIAAANPVGGCVSIDAPFGHVASNNDCALLGDLDPFPGDDKIGSANIVGPGNATDTGSVSSGNGGKGLTRSDPMINISGSRTGRPGYFIQLRHQDFPLFRRLVLAKVDTWRDNYHSLRIIIIIERILGFDFIIGTGDHEIRIGKHLFLGINATFDVIGSFDITTRQAAGQQALALVSPK